MKQCSTCKQWKNENEFYADHRRPDGLQCQCKPCQIASSRKYQKTKKGREAVRRAEQNRSGTTRRKVSHNRANRKYEKTEQGRLVKKNAWVNYGKNHPVRRRAKNAVNYAVANGQLPSVTTQNCQDCNGQAEHYHHPSYKKADWLKVVPLCIKCHTERHNQ